MKFPAIVGALGGLERVFLRTRGFVLEKTGDEAVDRAFARVAESLRLLLASPKVDATIIRDVTLAATTPLAIAHRLGRNFSGWSVHRMRAATTVNVTVREVTQSPASLDGQTLTLEATAACVVDVEVW